MIRKPLLAALMAAFTASAWAAYNSTLVPAPAYEPAPVTTITTTTTTTVPAPLTLDPNETVVTTTEETRVVPAPRVPVVERSVQHIEVPAPRLSVDERIQADVMDLLARNPNLSGKIGVVTDDRVVTLTGWTTTSGQAWRAGRDARGVEGVRQVVNEIRPRVGGVTS